MAVRAQKAPKLWDLQVASIIFGQGLVRKFGYIKFLSFLLRGKTGLSEQNCCCESLKSAQKGGFTGNGHGNWTGFSQKSVQKTGFTKIELVTCKFHLLEASWALTATILI